MSNLYSNYLKLHRKVLLSSNHEEFLRNLREYYKNTSCFGTFMVKIGIDDITKYNMLKSSAVGESSEVIQCFNILEHRHVKDLDTLEIHKLMNPHPSEKDCSILGSNSI